MWTARWLPHGTPRRCKDLPYSAAGTLGAAGLLGGWPRGKRGGMGLWSVLAVGQEYLHPEEAACLKGDGPVPVCRPVASLSTAMGRAAEIAQDRHTTDFQSAVHSKATYRVALTMNTEAIVADVS